MNAYIVMTVLDVLIACGYAVTGVNERSHTKALFAIAWGMLAGFQIAKAVL